MEVQQLARTSLANLVRLGSGMLLLVATPVLARTMSADEFNVWSLVIQIPAFVALLEVGVSGSVTHFVSLAGAAAERTRAVLASAGALELRMVAIGATGSAVIAGLSPLLFPSIPDDLVTTSRIGFVIVGVGASVGLLAAPVFGYFIAIGRNFGAALWTFGIRLVVAGLLIVFATSPLSVLFVIIACGFVANVVAHFELLWRSGHTVGALAVAVDPTIRRSVMGFMWTFAVWSVASFVANGLDTFIVGAFDFDQVGVYAVAVIGVTVFGGLHAALASALQPMISAAVGQPSGESGFASVLNVAAVINGAVTCAAAGLLIGVGRPALVIWVGADLGERAYPILCVLVVARMVTALIWPFILGVIASETHRSIRTTPLIEAGVNLAVSLVVTWRIGAIGAAIGTLVGSLVGVALHLAYNAPRNAAVPFDRTTWLTRGALLPLLCASPLFSVALLMDVGWVIYIAVVLGACFLSAVLLSRLLLPHLAHLGTGWRSASP